MKNLKTLIIKNGCFSECPKYLPNSLRVLEWWRFPSEWLPNDFQPKKLSILKLSNNLYLAHKLDSLAKKLVSLKVLNFDYNDSLKEIADVSSLQTLEEFSFRGCKNLVTVHSSVGFLSKLKRLNAEYCEKLRTFPAAIKLPLLKDFSLCGCSSLVNFPEILEEMANVGWLDLKGTGIKDLPCSFHNLSGLRNLEIIWNEMCKIPSIIFMMPQLSSCYIEGGGKKRKVSSEKPEEDEEEGLQGILTHSLPSQHMMKALCLRDTNLSDDFFPLAVAWLPNVTQLSLRGNNFTVLPECMKEFCFLYLLIVDDCNHLQEIRGIPPCLTNFSAVNCKSLSPRATRVLLNQELHEGRWTIFAMPGGRIPRWFEKRCSGASISFWFHGTEFPDNALFFAILLKDGLPSPVEVLPIVTVNGNQVSCRWRETPVDQLFIFHLSETIAYNVILRFENKWNHAEISYEAHDYYTYDEVPTESIAKEIGIHLLKQKISSSIIQDIRFTDPYKMTQLIIMMMMVSIVLPNHKKQPLLLETSIEKLSILKLPDYLYMLPKLDSLSKMLISLKVLNFDYSNSLKEIPDVSNLETLEEFSFEGCSNLVSVHSSVGFLPKLKILNAENCPQLRSFPPVINLPSLKTLGLSGCSSLEKFPEIQEEMKNLEELDLFGTGIKDLPCSFCNLSGLWLLYLEENEMYRIPSVIGMMPSLFICKIELGGNKGRVSGEQEEGFHGILTHSLPSSHMQSLFLTNCNLSDDFFPLAVAWFPNVISLVLGGNNFTILPECIQQFRFLVVLNVDDCEHLREIRGIPPCLTDFSAVNCKSLSPRSTSVLLNQQVHEGRSTHFVMPGGRIPRWFEWRSRGASISFWFRGTIFPYKSLCVAILLKHDILSPPLQVKPTVTINGNQVQFGRYGLMGQLFIFNLKRDDYYYEAPHFKRGWNHVKLSYEAYYKGFEGKVPSESIGKEIGMHVWKEESSSIMEDIRFTDPYKMTQLIIMMIMLSIAFPNHKNHPLLLQTCIGYWTLLFLTMYDLDNDSELGSEGSNISDGSMASTELAGAELGCAQM
ncbi:hypothetical protein Ahy_B05g074389 isoform C [Arachis hypogaea]|nr:hypothetical protein Ahy_B05g074389 isoform C [Arachis hypogaea]